METKKRILIVHNYYQLAGGEDTVVANEKQMLEQHGHHVVLYTRSNNELKQMNFFQKLLLPLTLLYNPRTVREVKKIIRDEQIDVVHVHNTLSLISPSVYYAAVQLHIPVVQTIHNFRLLCPAATFFRNGLVCEDCVHHGLVCALKHRCYRNSLAQTLACVLQMRLHRRTGILGRIYYICLTEFNREKLLSLKHIRPEQIFVKPNIIFEDKQLPFCESRSDFFIFAGRLEKLKGIDLLIEAWKQMGEDAPPLLVCGTGPLEGWCKEQIAQHHLNIQMKGFISNAQLRCLMAESRGLLFPSQWYETFGMSIVEAYSVGTPVIGSDLGNVGNIIQEGLTGYKFSPKSVQELIHAVQNCRADHRLILDFYKQNYSEEQNYTILNSIYCSVRPL